MKAIEYLKAPFKKTVPPFVAAGMLVVILFTTVWIVAAAIEGKWIFGINALSDLGACKNTISIILFNYGCVLTGFAGCWFGYGIMKYEKSWLHLAGIVTCIGCIFLMGVGAIPENLGDPHMFCAGTFGVCSVAAMVLSGMGDYKNGRKKHAAVSFLQALVIVIITPVLIQLGFMFGLYEALDIICILVWVWYQSCKYLSIIGFVEVEDPFRAIFDKNNA